MESTETLIVPFFFNCLSLLTFADEPPKARWAALFASAHPDLDSS
jgi:hypothetical protein